MAQTFLNLLLAGFVGLVCVGFGWILLSRFGVRFSHKSEELALSGGLGAAFLVYAMVVLGFAGLYSAGVAWALIGSMGLVAAWGWRRIEWLPDMRALVSAIARLRGVVTLLLALGVLYGLAEADVDMVMYAPANLPGLDALLRRSPTVLLLGGDPDVAAEAMRALGLSETVGLRPPVDEGVPVDVAPPVALPVAPLSEQFGTLWPGASYGAPTSAPDSADTAEVVDVKHARRVPYWKPATALALFALAVWAGWSVLPRGATG